MELQDLKDLLETEEQKESLNLRDLFSKFTKQWKWFIFSVALFLVAGTFYSLTLTPTFRVTTAILIKGKESSSSMKSQMDFLSDMDFMGAKDNVMDEVQVLNSKTLFRKMVIDLGLHTTYYRKTFFKNIELYKTSPYVVSMLPESLDTLAAAIKLNIHTDKEGVHITGESITGHFSKHLFEKTFPSLPAAIETAFGTLRITQNTKGIHTSDEIVIWIQSPLAAASELKNATTIELLDKKANVITLSTPTCEIKKGQDILNKLIDLYNKASVEEKNQIALNSVKFIDERLALITGELTTVEKNVEDYKQANKLTNIQAESELFIKQTGDFDKQRLDVETQINLMQFVLQYVKKEENKYGIVPNIGIKDESLLSILASYNKYAFERERLIRTTADNNPVIIDLDRQIKAMRAAIVATTENSLNGLLIRKRAMQKEDVALSSRIKDVPRQEREFLEIKRQQELKAALYTYLLQKREENSLTLAIAVPAARVIEEPLPEDKLVSKRASFYLAIALLIGLILPVVIIYIIALLSTKITDKAELQRLTQVPLLGELPDYKGKDMIVVKQGSREPIAEMYRLMRTNLQFLMHDKNKKVVNITSTEPGEGKSTFSINLALTLALTGKKVLMVGLDIRKPTLAEYIQAEHVHGITSYLSGIETDLKRLIHVTSLNENLYILPAGAVPPNPNELLLKDNLDELFALLRKEYDYIIVDTAPVGMVADTFLLDRLADVNLYIFRASYSHKANARFVNDIATKNKLKNLYIVLKGCDVSNNPYGYGKGKYGYYAKK